MIDIPYGYCHCGCGEKTNIAKQTSRRDGLVRGEPLRYISGHNNRTKPMNLYVAVEYEATGYCACGCGEKTGISTRTQRSRGWEKGKPKRYIDGHNRRGKKMPPEAVAIVAAKNRGKTISEEHRKRISEFNKGKTFSEESKKRMSKSRRGCLNHQWRGGRGGVPYSPDFTKSLKQQIRNRDNNECQICGKTKDEETSKRELHVHHIDYDCQNCEPFNLITLCVSCHTATNKNRSVWRELFIEKMIEIYNPLDESVACCA